MPAVTVRGGARLRRFFFDFERASEAAVARALAKVIRQSVIPALRTSVPRRTGRLRRSLRVVQREQHVEIRSVFYGRFIRLQPDGDTLAERALQLIEGRRDSIRAQVEIELRQELGI